MTPLPHVYVQVDAAGSIITGGVFLVYYRAVRRWTARPPMRHVAHEKEARRARAISMRLTPLELARVNFRSESFFLCHFWKY